MNLSPPVKPNSPRPTARAFRAPLPLDCPHNRVSRQARA